VETPGGPFAGPWLGFRNSTTVLRPLVRNNTAYPPSQPAGASARPCTVESRYPADAGSNGHVRCPHLSVSNCASTIDGQHQPRRQERAIARLVRPLFCFDQLARARPAAPCPAEAPRSLQGARGVMPPRHEPLVPSVRRTTARTPPAIPPRPWIGRRPVCGHTCSRRIRASVPYRNPNELLRARRSRLPAAAAICCVRKLHRELSARSSTSKPLAAASAFSASSCVYSFREAGPHARPSSEGPS
jgi:hypothetical protein